MSEKTRRASRYGKGRSPRTTGRYLFLTAISSQANISKKAPAKSSTPCPYGESNWGERNSMSRQDRIGGPPSSRGSRAPAGVLAPDLHHGELLDLGAIELAARGPRQRLGIEHAIRPALHWQARAAISCQRLMLRRTARHHD